MLVSAITFRLCGIPISENRPLGGFLFLLEQQSLTLDIET